MTYTVYKTVNLKTNQYYIGVHGTINPHDQYLGSGTIILRAVEKYGKDNFKKEILFEFWDVEAAYSKERELLSSCLADPLCYNIKPGGFGARVTEAFVQMLSSRERGRVHSTERRKKNSLAHLGHIRSRNSIQKSVEGFKKSFKEGKFIINVPYSERAKKTAEKLRGRIPPDEEKERNSKALKLKWQDPEWRTKMVAARRRRNAAATD